jgi:hypothetical protein
MILSESKASWENVRAISNERERERDPQIQAINRLNK